MSDELKRFLRRELDEISRHAFRVSIIAACAVFGLIFFDSRRNVARRRNCLKSADTRARDK